MATEKALQERFRQRNVLKALLVANNSYGIHQESSRVPQLLEAINMMRKSTRLNIDYTKKFLDDMFKENFRSKYGKNGTYDDKAFFDIEFDKTQKKFVCEFYGKCGNCSQFNPCDVCDVYDVDDECLFGEHEDLCDRCYCDDCEGLCQADETTSCVKCHRKVRNGCASRPENESIINGFCDDCYCDDCETDCKNGKIYCKNDKCGVKCLSGCEDGADVVFEQYEDGCGFCKKKK